MANYDAYDPYDGATQYQSNQQNQPSQPSQSAEEVENSDKSLNSDQKKAVVAAGVGTAALGGAAYGLSMLEDSDNREANGDGDDSDSLDDSASKLAMHTTPAPHPPVSVPDPTPVDPTGGLTGFDKAFAEARSAFGAGHTFQYEGGTYNTYTKEEEANLTPDERNSFLASNNLMPEGHGHHQAAGTALASNDPDNFPSVTLDTDHHSHVASNEPSVSVIHDDSASVSLDTDNGLHDTHLHDQTTDPVATLDDHFHDDHHDLSHDLNDPAHDFDNHADVSDFT